MINRDRFLRFNPVFTPSRVGSRSQLGLVSFERQTRDSFSRLDVVGVSMEKLSSACQLNQNSFLISKLILSHGRETL